MQESCQEEEVCTPETIDSEVVICPVEDCNLTVDIILQSSDGKLLGAHQRNLEIYTAGFPIAGSAAISEPVILEETFDVLFLMLQYTHNVRQPSLDDIDFTLLASLAEAVEKYMIYSAIEVCKVKMTLATYDHPNEVFFYSAKHDYLDLVDKAAKLTLKNPALEFISGIHATGLHDDVAFRWLRYHSGWMEVLVHLLSPTVEAHKKRGSGNCNAWNHFQLAVFEEVRRDMSTLDDLLSIATKQKWRLHDCCICCTRSDLVISQVKEKIKKLPNYSEA